MRYPEQDRGPRNPHPRLFYTRRGSLNTLRGEVDIGCYESPVSLFDRAAAVEYYDTLAIVADGH